MKTCAACGEQSPDRAKFCLECGAPLAESPSVDRRERRVISVLFADLVGFTSRSEQLDVEDVQGFLSRYHLLLRRELERHGGTVEKFVGDAVMALFGAPVAHEDDAERAVRAALAIQDAVAELRESDAIDLHVRVGVTTGEALVVLSASPLAGEGMASGDVVNTAARLQAGAPTDGVLVDEATHRATERSIRYREHEPLTAKGKADPVAVWQALEPRSLLPEHGRSDDLPLVGREAEASQLVAAFERSMREPSTQLLTLVGAPGIGKTRLVQELQSHVERLPALVRWRRGRSLAYGEGVAFWALGEMVKAQAGILESDSADEAAAKIDEAVAGIVSDERDRDWVARHLRPLVGLEATREAVGAEGGQVEAFAAWRRFFEALAEDGPTVLVFEDLHWADDALIEFVDLLAERAGGVPLMILCTARSELLERRPTWGGGKANAQTISLAPLSDDDTARLVAALLEQALLPAETQAALLAAAEGNPLYAQEYVRMLRDQGLLVKEAAGWRLVAEPDSVPDSVQAIIAARLDTLNAEERRLVQDAAVVGRTAWLGAICALSDTDRWQAEEHLHRLERKQLVRRARRSSVAGDVEFAFTHALTQNVAYAQMPRAERAERHERAAGWIDQLAGGRDDRSEMLAHHYTRALELARQTGADVAHLAPKARVALAEAGRQALSVHAYAAASRYLDAALRLTEDDVDREQLLLDRATARYYGSEVDAATLEEALDAQVHAERWEAAAEASHLLAGWLITYAGDADRAHAVRARAMEYALRCGYVPIAAALIDSDAYGLVVTGHCSEALSLTEEWIARSEAAGDDHGRATLLARHGSALSLTGDPRGIDELREAAAALAQRGDPGTWIAYANLGEALALLGDLKGAAEPRAEAARWTERFGRLSQIRSGQTLLAEAGYHAGDWDAASTIAEALASAHDRDAGTRALWVLGRIAIARGAALTLAEAYADDMRRFGQTAHEPATRIAGLSLLALVRHHAGQSSAAQGASRQLLEEWRRVGGVPDEVSAVAELAAIDGHESVIGSAAELLPDTSRWKIALMSIAERRYADAATTYREMGSAPLEALAHLRAAAHAEDKGQPVEAEEHARRALSFYRGARATRYVGQATRLLSVATETPLGA